jgi:hypothetical protein
VGTSCLPRCSYSARQTRTRIPPGLPPAYRLSPPSVHATARCGPGQTVSTWNLVDVIVTQCSTRHRSQHCTMAAEVGGQYFDRPHRCTVPSSEHAHSTLRHAVRGTTAFSRSNDAATALLHLEAMMLAALLPAGSPAKLLGAAERRPEAELLSWGCWAVAPAQHSRYKASNRQFAKPECGSLGISL